MLRIQIEDTGDENAVSIVENDRGEWKLKPLDMELSCFHLVGFDSEDVITVHFMEMQDRSADIVVVHSCCDNPAQVAHARFRGIGFAPEKMTAAINGLLAAVCDYPETLD